MSENRDEWVRVESEDELRPGMVRIVRPRDFPGKPELVLCLFARIQDPSPVPHLPWHVGTCPTWRTSGEGIARVLCPIMAIREGRLYRLRDLPAEETTTVETKRRVSMKAGR